MLKDFYIRIGKRLMDVSLAFFSVVILSWLLLLIILAIRLTSPGPVVFKQSRVGLWGNLFTIYKFRSMPLGTGDISSDQLGTVQIDKVGKFIRRTNLDELPQLFNILKGDMSLVGPRPPLPSQNQLIDLRRNSGALSYRPGLTGLAQVNGFDGMSVAEKAAFDTNYVNEVSFMNDMAIILRTFIYVSKPPPTY